MNEDDEDGTVTAADPIPRGDSFPTNELKSSLLLLFFVDCSLFLVDVGSSNMPCKSPLFTRSRQVVVERSKLNSSSPNSPGISTEGGLKERFMFVEAL